MPLPPDAAQITPYLVYDDPRAALEFLQKAFGFRLRVLVEDGTGGIAHCELEYGRGVLGIGAGTPQGKSPRALGGAYTSSLHLYVDDIDAHCARAKAAGAHVFRELASAAWGDRGYGCTDPEGHVWYFGFRYDQAAWERSIAGSKRS
jgi:uncharacterized glyoxalase superfamily protein PhnB